MIHLPYPPSTNTLYMNVRGRGRVKTRRYLTWIKNAGGVLMALKVKPVSGRVNVSISILRPDKRKRDIDNLAKAILDLLVNHKIIEDDRYIERLTIGWRYTGNEGAMVEVLET